ncbi:MAG: ABC transporter substrate-binding protein [Actinomycetales bacterium]
MALETGQRQPLELCVLGALEVRRGGTPLALGGAQQRAVLAVLLAEAGTTVSLDRVADTLWGEHPPAGFVTSIQTYVFRLRELLEPGRARGAPARLLVTEPGGYRLHLDGQLLDAAQFRLLAAAGATALDSGDPAEARRLLDRALALWRGDVLADLEKFEFVEPYAAQLDELRLAALEHRIEAELALGHHAAVLPELRHLVSQHPLREGLRAELMLALYRAGRQSEALSAYQKLRHLLREELGVDPGSRVANLHLAMLSHDPALDITPTPRPAQPPARPRMSPGPPTADIVTGGRPAPPRRRRPRLLITVVALAAVTLAGTTVAVRLHAKTAAAVALPANSVGEISTDGMVTAAVPVGANPLGLKYGAGSLWVANRSDNSVWRLDPKARTVIQRIGVGLSPEALAVTPTDVWVANSGGGTVSRINVESMTVTRTITVGTQPKAIAAGPHDVWVALSGDDTVRRIDPATNLVDDPIPVGGGPDGLAMDGTTLWVANAREATVLHIDGRTREEVSSPVHVGAGPRELVVSGNDVWVANQLSTNVSRIDRTTWSSHTIEVGDGPGFLTATRDGIWVSAVYSGRMTRIDPRTERVTAYQLPESPRGVASDGRRVWVAAGALADRSHVGGTLTVAAERPAATDAGIDPATAYNMPVTNAERLVYNALVTLAYGSFDSQVLVPNLATTLPEPSDGGLTYTFTLRPDIRYSNGTALRASDFVLGLRRALTLTGGNPALFARIKGAQNCIDHPGACDLSRGVSTDERQRRVTFHLEVPDPEFLYKISNFVFPSPPGTPLTKVTAVPIPGTGPYVLANVTKDQVFELRRNPFFHRWSSAAQPEGYPDVIRWLAVPNTQAAVAAVDSGRADLAWLTPLGDRRHSAELIERLSDEHPTQLHKDLLAATGFLSLNAATAPFNNVLARRAVNYAVDRRILVNLNGGPLVAQPNCQTLPPEFPGQTPYCPYTSGPQDGTYHGPDLAQARRLVTASGTRGAHVTIYSLANDLAASDEEYVGQALRRLGYRVTVTELANTEANGDWIFDPTHHVQVLSGGWIADYPSPANFYGAIYACGAPAYPSEYCNRALDAKAAAALSLETSRPAEALARWGEIDHALTRDAVGLFTTTTLDWYYTSRRALNFQGSQIFGPALSQIWVR